MPDTTESGAVLMTPRFVMRSHLKSIETIHGGRWEQTPRRSKDSRDLLNGDKRAPIAEGFTKLGIDVTAFRVDLPHKYLVPYHQRNLVAKDKPRLSRFSRGDSIQAKTEATKVEQIMQAVMDDKQRGYKWPTSVDIVQNDGVCLSIALPDLAAMQQDHTYGEVYHKTSKVDGTKIAGVRPKPRYQRDGQGRSRAQVGKGFRVSESQSKKSYESEKRDDQSRYIPLAFDMLPPTAFIPVFGPGMQLDAVLVKRKWTITEIMKRRWIWEGMQAHMSPDGPALTGSGQTDLANKSGGSGAQVEVTELYAVDYIDDEDGKPQCHPYVAYLVDGKPTRMTLKSGDVVDAIVDLREKCGLTRLPCVLRGGAQWPGHPDADRMFMPFPIPFAQSWLAADAILTGAVVALWWGGFPTLLEEVIPGAVVLSADNTVNDDTPDDAITHIEPLAIMRPPQGTKYTQLQMTTSPDAYRIVDILLGANEEQGPPDAASGGGGQSGFQASLARAFSDDALADIKLGCLELYAETASLAFEILSGLAREYGPIPIQKITPVTIGTEGGPRREIMDLTADLAGGDRGLYDLDAAYPSQPNLARGQQLAEWAMAENPLVLIEEFRKEVMNDENPEIFLARRLRQRMLDSPEMLAKLFELVAQLSGDEDEAERLRAIIKGSAQEGQPGQIMPASAAVGLDGLVPAAPMPIPLTGAGGAPNPAALSLAGAVGGPSGAPQQAAAAGGYVPANLPGIG